MVNVGRFLRVRAAPGNRGLIDLSVPLVRQILDVAARSLHAFSTPGPASRTRTSGRCGNGRGGSSRLDVTLRASRYPHRVRAMEAIARRRVRDGSQEPGLYVGAPIKEIRLAETRRHSRRDRRSGGADDRLSGGGPGPKKDRWHPLHTTSAGFPEDLLTVFRTRQHEEQAFRVGVHDAFLDAAPCATANKFGS